MRLFHFTGETNWLAIAVDGEIITLLDKNVRYGPNQRLVASDERLFEETVRRRGMEYAVRWREANDIVDGVVWLTSHAGPKQEWMIGMWTRNHHDKGAIRIEVDVPDAVPWTAFARRAHFPKDYREGMNLTSGKEESLWYVVARRIPQSEWVEVTRTSDGSVIWRNEEVANVG